MATQRWPTAWLLTDERLGSTLDDAMTRAAAFGAGIVVRHHRSTPDERRALAGRVLALGAPLAIARHVSLARELGADLVHNPMADPGALAFSLSVHDEGEAMKARQQAASLVFVSPVYPTKSHPGQPALGMRAALRLARLSGCRAIALGGMNQVKAAELLEQGFSGWAGTDCWRD